MRQTKQTFGDRTVKDIKRNTRNRIQLRNIYIALDAYAMKRVSLKGPEELSLKAFIDDS